MLDWLQSFEGMSFAFDFIMLACIFGGFFLWRRTSSQQQAIEAKLAEATAQLEKASRLMASSMAHMQRAVQQSAVQDAATSSSAANEKSQGTTSSQGARSAYSKAAGQKRPVARAEKGEMPSAAALFGDQVQQSFGANDARSKPAARQASRQSGGASLAQVLHMRRQGCSETEIASQLGIPQEEVELMIKVHMAKG